MIRISVRGQVWEWYKGFSSFSDIFSRLRYSIVCRPGRFGYLPMHLPVLAVGHGKLDIEIVPSIVCFHFFIPYAASTVEYSSGGNVGVCSGEILCFANWGATCFWKFHTVMNHHKEVFHQLLVTPLLAHVIKVLLKVNSRYAAIREIEMIKHTLHDFLAKLTMSLFKTAS